MTEAGISPQPFFESVGLRAVEVGVAEVPRLQHFFETNPEYFVSVNGQPAGVNEAQEEVFGKLPAGWPFSKKWVVGLAGPGEDFVAMVSVVSDLLAPGVWHIGLLIVATEAHGSGTAQSLFRQLERWAVAGGATWLRLGVVAGNARAERFWEQCGFIEVRKREGIQMGTRVNTVRVMAKALRAGTLSEYLALVVRDNPQAP